MGIFLHFLSYPISQCVPFNACTMHTVLITMVTQYILKRASVTLATLLILFTWFSRIIYYSSKNKNTPYRSQLKPTCSVHFINVHTTYTYMCQVCKFHIVYANHISLFCTYRYICTEIERERNIWPPCSIVHSTLGFHIQTPTLVICQSQWSTFLIIGNIIIKHTLKTNNAKY